MTFNEKLNDAERGILRPPSTTTPTERFLLFRDIAFGKTRSFFLASRYSELINLSFHPSFALGKCYFCRPYPRCRHCCPQYAWVSRYRDHHRCFGPHPLYTWVSKRRRYLCNDSNTFYSYRSHLRISKITSAMWFEVGWVTVLTVVDFSKSSQASMKYRF